MRNILENIEKSLIFLVFLSLALADWRVILFGVPVYLPEAIVFSAVLLRIARVCGREAPKRRIPTGVLVATALILVGAVVSVTANGADREALGALKSWFLFPMAFGWLILRSDFSEKDFWKAVFCWFFGIALLSAGTFLFPGLSSETYDGRLRSVFPSPNHLGFFLEYGAILGIGLIIFMRHRAAFLLPVIIAESAVLSALLMTESAGASLSVGIASVVLLTTGLFPVGVSKKILGIGSVLVIFLAISAFLSVDRDALGSGETRSPLASRVMIWNASFRMIAERPLVGIGPRNFQEAYLALQPEFPPYLEWAVPHPHDIFLAFWLFTGLPGLLGLVLLLGLLLRTALFGIFSDPVGTDRLASSLLLGLLVAFCIHGLVDTPYFRNDLSYAFWAIAAFALAFGNKKGAEAPGKLYKL